LLAETASALVAVVFLFRNDLTTQTIGMIVFSWLMILIALIDWNDRIIPNKVLLCGTFLAILYKFFFTNENIIADSAGALIVGALIAGIAWCVSFFLKRQAMGWGDIKFITLITFMTSWQNGLLIIWTSAVIGSLAGIIWKRQRPDLELRIPFGTILAVMTIGSFVIGTLGDWAIRSLSHWVIDPLGH
jgi:leader peptidase (prepilin peptidase)/N-methyltransferase